MTDFLCSCGREFIPGLDPWPDVPLVTFDMRLSYCPYCLPGKIAARDRMYADAQIVRSMDCQLEGHIRSTYSQCLRCGAATAPYYHGWPDFPADGGDRVSG